jgi:hypothetical protein
MNQNQVARAGSDRRNPESPPTPVLGPKEEGRPNPPKGPPPPKPTTMKQGPVLHSEQLTPCSSMNTAQGWTALALGSFKINQQVLSDCCRARVC